MKKYLNILALGETPTVLDRFHAFGCALSPDNTQVTTKSGEPTKKSVANITVHKATVVLSTF